MSQELLILKNSFLKLILNLNVHNNIIEVISIQSIFYIDILLVNNV